MNANTYMNGLAKKLIPECKTNNTICMSKDGVHFAVCVNHTMQTSADTIAKRALDSVKMALRVHGNYVAAEALEYLHIRKGDCLKVKDGNNMYTVLWIAM